MLNIGIGLLDPGARMRSQAHRDLLAFKALMVSKGKVIDSTASDQYFSFASQLYDLPAGRLDFAALPGGFNAGSGGQAFTFQKHAIDLLSTARWDAGGILTDKNTYGGNPAVRYNLPSSTRYFSVMHVSSGAASQPDYPCRIYVQPNGHYFTDASMFIQGGTTGKANSNCFLYNDSSTSLIHSSLANVNVASTTAVLLGHQEPYVYAYVGTTRYQANQIAPINKQFSQAILGARYEASYVAFGIFTHKFLLVTPLDLEPQWTDMLDLYNATLGL